MTVMFDPASPERFRAVVARRLGLAFDDSKLVFLGEVLRRRADARGLPIEVYLAGLEAGEYHDEIGPLAEELTVGETYFFRNNDQFRAFRAVVLPERMKARGGEKKLRLLSAACSSGDEAYTLAMITKDAVPAPWQVSIRAVDINPAAVRRARAGRFTNWSLRETPPAMQEKWFRAAGRELIVADEIRDAVQFEERNLTVEDGDLFAAETYDAIFCRNVIMYFSPATQQQVIARLARSLAPGGYLFLGHAETLRGLSHAFHLVHTHGTFYYQRREAGDEPRVIDRADTPYVRTAAAPATVPEAVADIAWFDAINNASKRIAALTTQPARAAPVSPAAATPVPPAWSMAGALDLMQRERYSDALDAMHAMPEGAGTDRDALLLRAMLLVQNGKLAAAAESCRLLLAEDELNAGANYVLALCFEGTRNRADAAHHYRVAAYLDPNFAMPILHLGMIARRDGDLETARSELTRALDLLKREDSARLLMFGGGFTRDGLIRLCEAELKACEGRA